MAQTLIYKKVNYAGKYKQVLLKYTLASGDTTITAATGLKIIYAWFISAPSVAAKYVTTGTVSGGTITITVTDPLAAEYFYVTAFGI